MPRTLIIDGQILQTGAWHRGMGKYTVQLMKELDSNKPDDLELAVLFNSALECDQKRFDAVRFFCPNIKQLYYSLPLASDKRTTADEYKRVLSRAVHENAGIGENYFLITGPFFFDYYAEFPENFQKLMLFYDLTPMLFWKDLGGYFPPELYFERFQKVLEADRILAISETTRRDLLKELGLPPDKVININGGFTKIAKYTHKPKSFRVPTDYILFPSGDMPHKNNDVAIKGFEEYRRRHDGELKLLVTSSFHDNSRNYLESLSSGVIFTGNVSDEELEWLYEHAKAVLFASKYEGLGLPILDGIASQKPIITSRIPVFQEISKAAFYYFEYDEAQSLAKAIENAINHKDLIDKTKHYPAILHKYTWRNTADTVLEQLRPTSNAGDPIDKPRIAVACIHPGIDAQIGRLAEPLHYSLSRRFDVDYYFDANGYHYREMERPTFLDHFERKPHDITKLTTRSYKKYKAVVYLLDTAAFPSRVAQRAGVLPGIAVTSFVGRELARQNKIFKDVVLDNQRKILQEHSFDTYQKLADGLAKEIKRISGN